MKIFVCTDLEGAAGVWRWEHCTPEGRYYDRSRRLLTEEVNAAVTGALEAGASEVVVWDAHGCGGVDIDGLHPEAKYLAGTDFLGYGGLDESFDGLFFVGQHAMNRTERANLCHSYSSVSIFEMRLNEMPVGEFGLRTAGAGALGVPALLLTGDDCACQEARGMVLGIVTAEVKISCGREGALSLAPEKAREIIKRAAVQAVTQAAKIKPYTLGGPYELVTEYYAKEAQTKENRGFDRPRGHIDRRGAENLLDLVV